jgi:hypothetical protein
MAACGISFGTDRFRTPGRCDATGNERFILISLTCGGGATDKPCWYIGWLLILAFSATTTAAEAIPQKNLEYESGR